jgi:hypothetical protein
VHYGMKSASFGPYMKLPEVVGRSLELAVGGAPHELLTSNGWSVRDAAVETRDPCAYQRYIQQSKAEFSVAKQGYVITRSGWFSDRSIAYLASGRPVLVQETGFSDWMRTGCGVLPFTSPEEAIDGVEEINRRYAFHCGAAREIAEEYFDANNVLPRLIERAMNVFSS